jgi:hypothetical protein
MVFKWKKKITCVKETSSYTVREFHTFWINSSWKKKCGALLTEPPSYFSGTKPTYTQIFRLSVNLLLNVHKKIWKKRLTTTINCSSGMSYHWFYCSKIYHPRRWIILRQKTQRVCLPVTHCIPNTSCDTVKILIQKLFLLRRESCKVGHFVFTLMESSVLQFICLDLCNCSHRRGKFRTALLQIIPVTNFPSIVAHLVWSSDYLTA